MIENENNYSLEVPKESLFYLIASASPHIRNTGIMLKYLMENPDVNVNETHNDLSAFFLCFSRSKGEGEITNEEKLLIELYKRGANPFIKETYHSPLAFCIAGDKEFLFKKILNDYSLEVFENFNLLRVSSSDQRDEKLIKNPEFLEERTCNLFNYAVSHHSESILEALLSKGWDINKKDSLGRNALFYCKNERMVNFLLEKGIDYNVIDKYGNTPIVITNNIKDSEQKSKVFAKMKTLLKDTKENLVSIDTLFHACQNDVSKTNFKNLLGKEKFDFEQINKNKTLGYFLTDQLFGHPNRVLILNYLIKEKNINFHFENKNEGHFLSRIMVSLAKINGSFVSKTMQDAIKELSMTLKEKVSNDEQFTEDKIKDIVKNLQKCIEEQKDTGRSPSGVMTIVNFYRLFKEKLDNLTDTTFLFSAFNEILKKKITLDHNKKGENQFEVLSDIAINLWDRCSSSVEKKEFFENFVETLMTFEKIEGNKFKKIISESMDKMLTLEPSFNFNDMIARNFEYSLQNEDGYSSLYYQYPLAEDETPPTQKEIKEQKFVLYKHNIEENIKNNASKYEKLLAVMTEENQVSSVILGKFNDGSKKITKVL